MTSTMDKKPKGGMALMVGMSGDPKSDSQGDDEQMPGDEDSQNDQAGGKNYDIDVPEGFEPPDDAQEGDEFDATVRCHMEGDKLCIDSINGIKTTSDSDNEGDEEDESSSPPEQDKTPSSLEDAVKQQYSHPLR